MEAKFWHQKWEKNEIGFHTDAPNPLLLNYFNQLALPAGARVFLPLCGKTLDIAWLLAEGYRVVGVELSQLAIEQLFEHLGETPVIEERGQMLLYRANNLDIFVGDIFDLSRPQLGPVDAIYDRAALIALPAGMRDEYARHLIALSQCAKQLLITLDYDQGLMAGPPFSIPVEVLKELYQDAYQLTLLNSKEVEGGLKGECEASENAWLLD